MARLTERLSATWSTRRTWGTTPAERAAEYPCDRFLREPDDACWRAVDVAAPAPTVFRWLCQLRVAPYSYDTLDNFGRRSPQTLTPGLERLELGQRFMTIFSLVDFEPDRSITLLTARWRRIFGDVAGTYMVTPQSPGRSRLLVKLLLGPRRLGPATRPYRELMPLGELFMMRRQLLNLKGLAES
jgi:hypothetical protein